MYLKLAFRNAKRSLIDYLLYIFTVTILVSIMCVSNCIAAFGNMSAGFKTASLPLLIALIMVILIDYINTFMMRQRSKELATYLLLGMEQTKLSFMFLFEVMVIGAACFVSGALIGLGVFCICFHSTLQGATFHLNYIAKGILQTLAYFCMIELLSAFRMKQKLCKLQINQLMNEKRRNQPHAPNKKAFWGTLLLISVFSLFGLLFGVAFLPDAMVKIVASLIMIPVLCCILAYYKWIYALISSKRLLQSESLYGGNRLYLIAEITTGTNTSANINTVFCVCLLLAAMSFMTGTLMLTVHNNFFAPDGQKWMGFLQISICIIFMVIYFSILSFMQIIELKRQAKNIQILHYMGKNQVELKSLVKTQILFKLFLPTPMCCALLGTVTPLVNHKLNEILPATANNLLLIAIGGFTACFAVLYLCYFLVIYAISTRYIKTVTKF